jgi:hypothetical protein
VEGCGDDIINWALLKGTCRLGQVFAQNRSIISRGYLGCCPLIKTVRVEDSLGGGCTCWDEKTATINETDYLDATVMQMEWDSAGEGSCPLNCDEAKEDYTPKVSL